MKKITLLFYVLSLSFVTAQTTYDVNWQVGISIPDASFTIEQGDTMRWTWTDALPHSVTSDSGSQEAFDSGVITGAGTVYSFTFSEVGTNPYRCDVHSNMEGIITVEAPLSIDDKFAQNVKFYPNPVDNIFTITSLYQLDTYSIYDISGRRVAQGKGTGNFTQLEISNLNTGMYFVKVTSGDLEAMVQIIKN
jgi:plastocyanin